MSIMCFLVVSATIHQLVLQPPIQLVEIYMEVEFPVLQVTDILMLNAGPNFSKLCFWKMLQIKKIVYILFLYYYLGV